MRKITLFSLILTFFIGLFGFFEVSAQQSTPKSSFYWSNTGNQDAKIQYCNGQSCTLENGIEASAESVKGNVTDKKLSEFIQDIVVYLLGFISLIGVIYIIWAGFRIMTSAGDDDSLANSKKTILYVALGMIVMWLAYSIVSFIMTGLQKTAYNKNNFIAFSLVPTANAQAYTESESGTFGEYKYRVMVAAEELEAELQINKKVSPANISKLKSLIQQAFDRLPDKNVEAARVNESNKRYVDMKLDIALKTPDSYQAVGDAISQVATFIQSAKIETVQGGISATPLTGNAPLVTSFSAQNVIDPSGTIPPNGNYIWWIRENGGRRTELGRGPSLTYKFANEGTYTINLDVVSASKNSKGRTDVLPLSTSVNVQVQPKLGEITLLVNGVNVTNLSEIKISPIVASQGLIFDATASRAIGNGQILETNWDFGNGNTRKYKSAPSVERQVFATSGEFPVKLEFTSNDGKKFSKDITLKIKDPAATIKAEKLVGNSGESLSFSAETLFGNTRNVEYHWTVQSNETGKRETQSGNSTGFNYTFKEIGSYTVTLTTKSPNGDMDSDSKTVTIESREPIATLDAPKPLNNERPNTFIFDASRSYDSDTNSRQGLTYTWRLNGELIQLNSFDDNNSAPANSKGMYTFDSVGENTISVTVANKYGKISTTEQKFTVNSILAGNLLVTPQVAKVGENISFIAQSANAQFFTWNMGDGSPQKSGDTRVVQHTFKQTGVYNVSVTLESGNSNETTTITRKVYITDMDSPLAIINFSNASNNIIAEAGACDGKEAYILNRGESNTINGGNSVNVDGTTSNLDYTWKFMGKISTLSSISENFQDLGCFPITLTVKSKTNGASHTTTEYIKLTNRSPYITNITTNIDANKKDSQKIIVKATANGATDPDGVITSYIWYYTTGSDSEPQGLQITQKPEMTFVLPNITEKYTFGVIIEDNDGARIDTRQSVPLIIDNENSNVHMPLISLTVPNKVIKVGQSVNFSAEAKTIIGTNVTNKSQYFWDFDGDGKFDEKTNSPNISHTFSRAGNYNLRLKVTNNGVSNTKYHTIHVRNELKASVLGYNLPNGDLYLLNTSQGVYDKTKWTIGNFSSSENDSIIISKNEIPTADASGKIGTLQIASSDSESSTVEIFAKDIENISQNTDGKISYQSHPKAENNIIKISDPSEVLKISFYGNTATNYAIDTDLDMDGSGNNMNGVSDDDIDNREHKSYNDGSLFTISDFAYSRNRERKMKITLYDGNMPKNSETITVILDYLPENSGDNNSLQTIDTGALTDFEKEKLETLATMIRNLEDADRIVLMQSYNQLAENWMDTFEKAKNLVDLQVLINERNNVDEATKKSFSNIIDELLIGDANTTNSVSISAKLVRDLLPPNSPNYDAMVEKIDAIASHPGDRATNKILGEELLVMIQDDPNLEDDYKSIIHGQLRNILAHGDTTAVTTETTTTTKTSSSGGFMGLLWSIAKILGIILAVILTIGIGLFVFYQMKKTDENMRFQDFIIDQFANRKSETEAEKTTPTPPVKTTQDEHIIKTATPEEFLEQSSRQNLQANNADNDPLKSFTIPEETKTETTTSENNFSLQDAKMPDWLNPTAENNEKISTPTVENVSENPENISTTQGGLPDWLAPIQEAEAAMSDEFKNSDDTTQISQNSENISTQGGLPDWLAPVSAEQKSDENISTPTAENLPQNNETQNPETENVGELPDWLANTEATQENISTSENSENIFEEKNFDENNFSYTQKKGGVENFSEGSVATETKVPDWMVATPIDLDENPSETTENTEEKNSELPDWLQSKISETETSIPEKISENSLENSLENNAQTATPASNEIPDWLVNSSQISENSENIITPAEENIPDWLVDSAQKETTSEQEIITEDAIIPEISEKISENSPENSEDITIPEWLSGKDFSKTENISEENLETLPEKILEENSAETAKIPQKKSEENSAIIPDWLADGNTGEQNISEENLEQKFEEKIEKQQSEKNSAKSEKNSDDTIPEWLK